MSDLEFTGERFVPGTRGEIWIEHWHRYHFAAAWTKGKRVLDAACGEGYGSALLARDAAEVTGVDVSAAAIAHARRSYAERGNLRFVEGSCTRLPLADASVDVAVSFETIEHIEGQEAFVDELARVLVPGGLLVLSCPNKLEYTDRRGFRNEYHVKELYREELQALLARRFPHLGWYGQKPTFFSVIVPEGAAAEGRLVEVEETDPSQARTTLDAPLYYIVTASREPATLAALSPPLHVLSDRGDWVHKDYEKVFRMMEYSSKRCDELEADLARLRGELARRDAAPAAPRGLRAWIASLLKR